MHKSFQKITKGPVIKYVYWGVEGKLGVGGGSNEKNDEKNYLTFGGGMRQITTFVGGTKQKMSGILCL